MTNVFVLEVRAVRCAEWVVLGSLGKWGLKRRGVREEAKPWWRWSGGWVVVVCVGAPFVKRGYCTALRRLGEIIKFGIWVGRGRCVGGVLGSSRVWGCERETASDCREGGEGRAVRNATGYWGTASGGMQVSGACTHPGCCLVRGYSLSDSSRGVR